MMTTNQLKHESGNPLRKMFLRPFLKRFVRTLQELKPAEVFEVGAGEGYLLQAMKTALTSTRMVGVDVDPAIVTEGHRVFPDLDLRVGDIYRLPEPDRSWDVVVASEVLEHLERPVDGLRELRRVSRRYILVSVPWEPWFRLLNFARGKHLRRFGNHPEHVNNWTRKSFTRFIAGQCTVERVIPSFPWTIIVARV